MLRNLAVFSLSIAVALSAFANSANYPAISRDELKQAIAAGSVTLIDVNGSESYAEGHLPGAIDFAVSADKLATLLPADKNTLIVAYCGGPRCQAYRQGADAAARLGYRNIRHYADGISGWKQAGERIDVKG
ncbi:MAG: rhodanese-like domain-containing protein [Opitutaceae bacterium]|nr:rhodanese-like domain-containing protein [Opitutaceae bacterium]